MIRLAFILALAATSASPQSYLTHPNQFGSTTYGSDGSVARKYDNSFGSTIYVTRPDGSQETCRTYKTQLSTSTRCR